MTNKPWLGNWRAAGSRVETNDNAFEHAYVKNPETAALAAAAPAMARALCHAEWMQALELGQWTYRCPCCRALVNGRPPGKHAADCMLDAALLAAGLDANAREEVRKAAKR